MDANRLGESNLGQQNQSIVPSTATSAAVCRSPIRPCSAIVGYRSTNQLLAHTPRYTLPAARDTARHPSRVISAPPSVNGSYWNLFIVHEPAPIDHGERREPGNLNALRYRFGKASGNGLRSLFLHCLCTW